MKDKILRGLRDTVSFQVQAEALSNLAQHDALLECDSVRRELLNLLGSSDELVRWKVVMLLGIRKPHADDGSVLIAHLAQEADGMVIHALVSALATMAQIESLRAAALIELKRVALDPSHSMVLRNHAFLNLRLAEGGLSKDEYAKASMALDEGEGGQRLFFDPGSL